MAGTEEFLNSG